MASVTLQEFAFTVRNSMFIFVQNKWLHYQKVYMLKEAVLLPSLKEMLKASALKAHLKKIVESKREGVWQVLSFQGYAAIWTDLYE